MMPKNCEVEQKELRQIIPELSQFIEASEQKKADTAQFIGIVRKHSEMPKLTPEIMHELIEKIVVYAPDKSSGHRTQQIDICFRFNVAVADSMVYDKKERLRRIFLRNLSVHTIKLLYRPPRKSEAAFLFVYQSTDYFGHDA